MQACFSGNMGRNVEIILLLNRRCPLNMGSASLLLGVHLILACARLSDTVETSRLKGQGGIGHR